MFTHLSVRSFYSLGVGTASIENICRQAQKLGFTTLALTEVNGLYGMGWFLQVCPDYQLAPIVGAEIRHATGRAVLLPFTRAGYSHLCHLISQRHLDSAFSLPGALTRRHEGLVVISDCFPLLEYLLAHGGTEELYVELRPGQNRSTAIAFSRKTGTPAIVTNDVHFHARDDYALHVKWRAIALKKTLKTVPPAELAPPEAWLKSAAQMAEEFSAYPEALANTSRIAGKCAAFRVSFDRMIFPAATLPAHKSSAEVLRELTIAAAQKKYMASPEVMARLEKELDLIIRKGFADTFLVMREIVQKAEYTCGRGSAAASLISHLLDITAVDPISCDLYFGRFLNEARTDPPDIDMDYCQDERRGIIDAIFADYGEQNVAMVANHNCMGMRQAIRRLAELEGLPQAEIAQVTRYFSGWGGSIEAFYKTHPMFRGVKLSDKWPQILQEAEKLVGIPSHLSLHPGGIVIAPDGIDHYVPRQRSKNGIVAIQTEKDQTEDFLRLVKVDILGNTSLCVIRDALAAIRKKYGVAIDYRDWRRFASDRKTCDLIARAQTMACFHIESASFLQLLQKIGPALQGAGPQRIFEVLVILSSIIRPASNKSMREFLRRFYGGKFEYLHPRLAPILSETYGLLVYQEHVNLVAMELAGFSEVEADALRKALTGKKSEQRLRALIRKYIEGCRRNGIAEEVAKQTAEQILQFVHYSFLKAHSASYVILALACVYLKAHYPAMFMAARLSYHGGFWGFRAYVSECQRLGLQILLPDLNASAVKCTGDENQLRIGLMWIQNVHADTKDRIIEERNQRGPFKSFQDFLRRVPLEQADMDRLIMAGVFDRLEPELAQAALHYLFAYWVGLGKPRDFDGWYDEQKARARHCCRPHTHRERLQREIATFGTLISCHPLEEYQETIKKIKRVKAVDLQQHLGKIVQLVGWPIASKEVTTKTDESMQFWAFEDETGIFHATLFPRAYEKFCRLLARIRPLLLVGEVEEEYGAVNVNILRMSALESL
jgi:error-prone DNA polymerase